MYSSTIQLVKIAKAYRGVSDLLQVELVGGGGLLQFALDHSLLRLGDA